MRIWLWLPVLIAGWCGTPAYAVDCAAWNTEDFDWSSSAVQTCLAAGADVEARDEYGRTPLHWAARYGNEAAIRALLDAGAYLEARDKIGETPLHEASQEAAIRALLDAGAYLEARNEDGQTPLHEAARYGDDAAIRALLDAGADAGARDENGKTPFDLIESYSALVGTKVYWRLNEARFR